MQEYDRNSIRAPPVKDKEEVGPSSCENQEDKRHRPGVETEEKKKNEKG